MSNPNPTQNRSYTLPFGIEIECLVPEAVNINAGNYHRGIQINNAPIGWNAQRDSSIRVPAGMKAVEVVSPVLIGDDGLVQIAYMVDMLQSLGATFNSSCGLHIHVDATHMTNEQKGKLCNAFYVLEKGFLALNGGTIQSRMSNQYCLLGIMSSQSRYQALNTQNHGNVGKNTVECRLWAATLELEAILAMVVTFQGLVARVLDSKPVPESFRQLPLAIAWQNIKALTIDEGYTITPDADYGMDDVIAAGDQKVQSAVSCLTPSTFTCEPISPENLPPLHF